MDLDRASARNKTTSSTRPPLATVAQLLRCLLLCLVIKLDPESSTHMKAPLRRCEVLTNASRLFPNQFLKAILYKQSATSQLQVILSIGHRDL